MARYIDADKLEPDTEWDFYEECYISYSQINIDTAETADVVEVVRCKDCIYGEIDDNDFPTQYLCHHHGDVRRTRESDYCSYGERAEDEANQYK